MISISYMVPKAGFEPARVSPPPPQDGVSTISTTSAYSKICKQCEEARSCLRISSHLFCCIRRGRRCGRRMGRRSRSCRSRCTRCRSCREPLFRLAGGRPHHVLAMTVEIGKQKACQHENDYGGGGNLCHKSSRTGASKERLACAGAESGPDFRTPPCLEKHHADQRY